MKPESELSPAYAESKRKLRLLHADWANGTLATDTVQNLTIEPVGQSCFYGGPLLIFEADDQTLLANGLVEVCDIPKASPSCRNKRWIGNDLIKTYRLPDGRVRLTISAQLVQHRAAGFDDFMTGLLSFKGS